MSAGVKYTIDERNIIWDGHKAELSYSAISQELEHAGFRPRSDNAIREKIREMLGVKKPEQLFGEENRWRKDGERGSATLLELLHQHHNIDEHR